jgi:ATP-dependent DNA helicase RecG
MAALYLKPLLQQGLLAMTIPEKPTSSKQRYVTTETGNEVLKR